jgi:hypothetical protein
MSRLIYFSSFFFFVILDEFLEHIEKNIYPNAQLLSLFFFTI